MDDRHRQSGSNREPLDPERAAARHRQGERDGDGRNAGESMSGMFGGDRFRGEAGGGERGYRGHTGEDTPPGSVPGGSYGGGGGYQRGGYDRGNYDPGVGMARGQSPRGSWSGGGGATGGAGGRYGRNSGGRPQHGEPRAYGGLDEYGSSPGGDWRQGYGNYGMSEGGGAMDAGGMTAGEDMFGRDTFQQEPGGYGFGGEADAGGGYGVGGEGGGRGGYGEARGGDWSGSGRSGGEMQPQRPPQQWGDAGGPNRGSQGHGWRGEARWEESARGSQSGRPGADWQQMEPWAVPGPYTGRGPEGYQRSEESIRNDVCERLTRHGRLDASRIRVQVERGEVILEGEVDSRTAKRMAEDTAESVMGVRDVQNRLRIEDGQRD